MSRAPGEGSRQGACSRCMGGRQGAPVDGRAGTGTLTSGLTSPRLSWDQSLLLGPLAFCLAGEGRSASAPGSECGAGQVVGLGWGPQILIQEGLEPRISGPQPHFPAFDAVSECSGHIASFT